VSVCCGGEWGVSCGDERQRMDGWMDGGRCIRAGGKEM
jgi:hypothetical protein